MDFEQFLRRAELNRNLADYLDDVSRGADPDQASRSLALGVLFGVAAYALYRMAKNHFDHQRGLSEVELREQMLEQVEALVESGWDRDKALAATMMVSKEVASLRADSAALEAALNLLKVGNEVSRS